jgi:hypothetical protein
MSESQPPPRQRGNPSMADIVRSVAVLVLIVLAIWLVGLLQTDTPDDPVGDGVEYADTAASARQAATYPLLAPVTLPDEWRANGVRFDPAGTQPWHLGVLTQDDRYIGLEQSKQPADEMIEFFVAGAERNGEVDVDGVTWVRYDGPDRAITLVQETPEVTTLVTTSTAPLADVETFIRRLAAE